MELSLQHIARLWYQWSLTPLEQNVISVNVQDLRLKSSDPAAYDLKAKFVSNEECIEKFKDFGANLENDLRFGLICFKKLLLMEKYFSIDKHFCAGGQEGKESCKVKLSS